MRNAVQPRPRRDWTVVFVIGCCTAACADTRPSFDDAWAAALRDSVVVQAEAIAADLAAEGPRAWLRHFDDDPRFSMASDGAIVFPSLDSARNFLQSFAPEVAAMDLRWADLRVDPIGPGLALFAGTYAETITDTAGHQTHFAGAVTGLSVHTAQGWRLRHLHWSSPISTRP